SVFNFHDTKTPTGSIDDRPVPQLVVPIASFLRSQDGPRFARGPSSRRLPFSRSESYDVVIYRSLGVLVLVAFTVACGGLLFASVGMALTPNLYAPWCGLRGCLGWCVAGPRAGCVIFSWSVLASVRMGWMVWLALVPSGTGVALFVALGSSWWSPLATRCLGLGPWWVA